MTAKVFAFLFSGQDLPVSMYEPRMTTTGKGDGLIMTYNKGIYRFKCVSSESCFFEKDDVDLKIERREHILLSVPKSLMEDCQQYEAIVFIFHQLCHYHALIFQKM